MREEIWIPCSLEDALKTKEHASQPCVHYMKGMFFINPVLCREFFVGKVHYMKGMFIFINPVLCREGTPYEVSVYCDHPRLCVFTKGPGQSRWSRPSL